MRKKRFLKFITITLVFLASIAFVLKLSASRLLTAYLKTGIGDCAKIPILCSKPGNEILKMEVDSGILEEFIPYKFPRALVSAPKGFGVVQEAVKKVYYKKKKRVLSNAVVYILYEEPDFFVNLFPQLKKAGIGDDYAFLDRVMNADINQVKGLLDAFFVIIKGIFTPDLGDQATVKMARFAGSGMRGFINYNFTPKGNYFDCNIFNQKGDYFKIYIRDVAGKLRLQEVFAIVSTARKSG